MKVNYLYFLRNIYRNIRVNYFYFLKRKSLTWHAPQLAIGSQWFGFMAKNNLVSILKIWWLKYNKGFLTWPTVLRALMCNEGYIWHLKWKQGHFDHRGALALMGSSPLMKPCLQLSWNKAEELFCVSSRSCALPNQCRETLNFGICKTAHTILFMRWGLWEGMQNWSQDWTWFSAV